MSSTSLLPKKGCRVRIHYEEAPGAMEGTVLNVYESVDMTTDEDDGIYVDILFEDGFTYESLKWNEDKDRVIEPSPPSSKEEWEEEVQLINREEKLKRKFVPSADSSGSSPKKKAKTDDSTSRMDTDQITEHSYKDPVLNTTDDMGSNVSVIQPRPGKKVDLGIIKRLWAGESLQSYVKSVPAADSNAEKIAKTHGATTGLDTDQGTKRSSKDPAIGAKDDIEFTVAQTRPGESVSLEAITRLWTSESFKSDVIQGGQFNETTNLRPICTPQAFKSPSKAITSKATEESWTKSWMVSPEVDGTAEATPSKSFALAPSRFCHVTNDLVKHRHSPLTFSYDLKKPTSSRKISTCGGSSSPLLGVPQEEAALSTSPITVKNIKTFPLLKLGDGPAVDGNALCDSLVPDSPEIVLETLKGACSSLGSTNAVQPGMSTHGNATKSLEDETMKPSAGAKAMLEDLHPLVAEDSVVDEDPVGTEVLAHGECETPAVAYSTWRRLERLFRRCIAVWTLVSLVFTAWFVCWFFCIHWGKKHLDPVDEVVVRMGHDAVHGLERTAKYMVNEVSTYCQRLSQH